ncbi:MOG interacting and ectopic P-granules protein 1-like [Ostrinia nubilalis]|uniref:MOG interacting and ectopic P-granules protein 1-like n=1 Tax=Ostrinia nubilalis TaxID=29057 RepID=UPI0030824E73
MNGDVNGTMEEGMEVDLPSSHENEQSLQKVTLTDCDDIKNNGENSNNSETGNHVDSETNDCSTGNDVIENLLNENSSESNNKPPNECSKGTPELQIDQEHSNHSVNNHCSNSNEHSPKPVSNSLNTEVVEQEKSGEINDQNNEDNHIVDKGEGGKQTSIDDESDESSAEDDSIVSDERKAEDTVSIDSGSEDEGDETSQDVQSENIRTSDIIVLDIERESESQNGDSKTSEIHEIESDNDDCVVASEIKSATVKETLPLRRSSRAIKRKRYNDDVQNGIESDIEEISFNESSLRKGKPIVINDTKALVEMAAKQMKHGNNNKKEPTVVIIDTNSGSPPKNTSVSIKPSVSTSTSVLNAQHLYQSIVARGTTVTPVSSTKSTSTQVSQTPTPPILPSLTDDMFVVEAPSFIVPYVYEKPSLKPFREFVFKLGKELEEQKQKDNKEEDTDKEKDDGSESEAQSTQKSEEQEKKKKSDRERRRRRNDDDDASWDGESASESDDALSDEEDKIVVKDKTEPIDQIKNVTELTADKICSSKANVHSSMDCSLGKFFINIGLNLVQEFVQTDLLKQQNRKLYKEKKSGQNTRATESSIAQLKKNLEFSKENNAPYVQPQKKCELCSFKTESMLAMANHLEIPHMKNNMYKCNFCSFEIRSPHEILYHMEAEHNVKGRLERAPSYHQCSNCPFEDNGKGKLARHLLACAKKFKPETNLAPPVDWEPPAKIPKIAKPRNNVVGSYPSTFNRSPYGSTAVRTPMSMGLGLGIAAGGFRGRGRSPMALPPRGVPILRGGGLMPRHTSPILMQSNFAASNPVKPKSVHHPSISITPLPRQPPPQVVPQQAQSGQSKGSFVICEICDGYIKDLEQLRNHMQWIHKVKIHPKMIYNRPPLNCQKCQFRFFTDQGLERHLLGSHGLVTSSMQEAANKGKDAGRCPVCGRVYQWKLLNHVARDHNLTLKPAHLSYKCTVCTATFGMYKQFENHVYSAHSVVAKRVMDKSKASAPPPKGASGKPLKINDEITIIPQPAKPTTTNAKGK